MKNFSTLFFKACLRNLHTSAQLYVQEVIQSLMSNSPLCCKVKNQQWLRTLRLFLCLQPCLLLIQGQMDVTLRIKVLEEEGVEMAPTKEDMVADTTTTMVVLLIIITLHIRIKLTHSLEISLLELILIIMYARYVVKLVTLHWIAITRWILLINAKILQLNLQLWQLHLLLLSQKPRSMVS